MPQSRRQDLRRPLGFGFWTLCVLILGYAFGAFSLAIEQTLAPAPILSVGSGSSLSVSSRCLSLDESVPLVHVKEINNGEIIGSVASPARLVIGELVVLPDADGMFRVSADKFLVNIVDIEIPQSALFVASSRGKKYYPVRSSAATKLVPKNRIYFRSAAEAEEMGYQPGR